MVLKRQNFPVYCVKLKKSLMTYCMHYIKEKREGIVFLRIKWHSAAVMWYNERKNR